ncbi:MAG TPA: CxxC-x17-CxxC domain-containing protein [Candidatus Paceibacterota bacterium]|nr:CxxC-x17-CxxC domain-containing protein [Candidatus Paceibacterota bacterium]
MGDFRQDSRGARSGGSRGGGFGRRDEGRSSFPKKSWGGSGGRDRGPVTMYQAVCDQCGKSCEVPFRPTQGKPVYCDVCFKSRGEGENSRGSGRFSTPVRTNIDSNVSKGNKDELKQLEILNEKMDQLIKAVEALSNTKPLVVKEKAKKKTK